MISLIADVVSQPMGWPEACTYMVGGICAAIICWAFFKYAL